MGQTRHILGLSGGKDSTALAILLHKEIPEMEYFFCDTGKELPETYEYLERIKARLGIKIEYLNPSRDFDFWLEVHDGYLPSPRQRWCTEQMKIKPIEKFIGNDDAYSYIGIRADENRDGYVSTKPNIKPVFPFKEREMMKADIFQLLEESGIGLPDYYRWRSRSGCFFCFFQRKYEWIMLSEEHPNLFQKALEYEKSDSARKAQGYTWTDGETLEELLSRKEQIIADHKKRLDKETEKSLKKNSSLAEVLDNVLEAENDLVPCFICHF